MRRVIAPMFALALCLVGCNHCHDCDRERPDPDRCPCRPDRDGCDDDRCPHQPDGDTGALITAPR